MSTLCVGEGDTPKLQQLIDRNGQKLSEFLGEKKYMVGDNLVFSDFSVFEMIDNMNFMSKGEIFTKYPNLKEYSARIKELPKFDKYWADDEKCFKRPFKMLHSKFLDSNGST